MNSLQQSAVPAEFQKALEHHKAGRLAEACEIYAQIIAAAPQHADALHMLGTIRAQTGQPAEGERLITAALKAKPDMAQAWSNHGNALALLKRPDDALASYERAIALAPDFFEAHYNRNKYLIELGRAEQALTHMVRALEAIPGHHVLETGRGNALLALHRPNDALAAYEAAIAAAPRNVDALGGRGLVLMELDRPGDALAAFDLALSLVPGNLASVLGRAQAQTIVGNAMEALATMDRVIAVVPRNPHAHYVRGHALLKLLRTAEALESFRSAAEIDPDMLPAVYNHANALRSVGRYDEAFPAFERVLAKDPAHSHALNGLAETAMQCADWAVQDRLTPLIEAQVRKGSRGLMPFSFLSLSESAELQLTCARNFTLATCPIPPLRLAGPPHPRQRQERIRIGYLSADFRRHAMAYQMAELFEIHDRKQFEIIGFSCGPDDGSPIRQRIARSFDTFHDVAGRSDEEIARLMHRCGIDVAVDLNGHTIHSRIGALAWRPALAQATYLGFPGTSGAPFIDYVIADATVAPFEAQPFFSERIVHLPGCYQVSDGQRRAAATTPSRVSQGLPEDGFVYCCFNSSYKISAKIFDVWMRILDATPGSVLWLVRGNETMMRNLKQAAAARGIEAERIVFCGAVEPDVHLARHALADLYLDTLPYNSHGTGSFALWGGLPMITCQGPTFAGRVAASLLRSIRMPELVAETLQDYEALAIELAADRPRLAGLRHKLAVNRTSAPLFDTDLFRRHIEAAYRQMHETAMRGEPPRSFAVPTLT